MRISEPRTVFDPVAGRFITERVVDLGQPTATDNALRYVEFTDEEQQRPSPTLTDGPRRPSSVDGGDQ